MMKKNYLIEAIIAVTAVIFIIPVILIFLTAFKANSEIINFSNIFPETWTLEHFYEIFNNSEEIPILRWFFNSVFISTLATVLVVFIDSLAAYALARLNLPGKKYIFAMIIGTLMIPGQILLVPVYLILNSLGWIDTPLALIIPTGANAFGVFLLHQFLLGIPKELEEAAAIDGCSTFGIYRHVILPLLKPAMATLAIFVFIGSWNDFLGPLVFLDSVDKFTLPVGIALFQTSYFTEYGLTLAASVICTLPVIIIFMIFQKSIIKGISLSGLKS